MRSASEQMLHAVAAWYIDHVAVVLTLLAIAVLVINGFTVWNVWVTWRLLRRLRVRESQQAALSSGVVVSEAPVLPGTSDGAG